MTKQEIIELQERLIKLGYGPLVVDGQYGKKTEAAYRQYLDNLDPETPTVIPVPDKKWWHSKALIAGVATVLVGIIGLFGYEIDVALVSEMILSVITIITGVTTVIATVKRKSQIDTVNVIPFIKSRPVVNQNTNYVDPRGSFSDDI